MKTPSLTVRLSLLFALSTTVLLCGLGWTLERAIAAHFRTLDHEELMSQLALVRRFLVATESDTILAKRLEEVVVGHPDMVVRVQATDGTLIFERRSKLLPESVLDPQTQVLRSPATPGEPQWLHWAQEGASFRGLLIDLPLARPQRDTARVVLGIGIDYHVHFMHSLHRTLGLSVVLVAIVAAGMGWGAVYMGLRPLRRVTSHVGKLDANHLGARLPEAGVPIEIKVLVDAFNAMLVRLEESFRRLSEFSADVAHELRTPISNLTLQTQVALSAARDSGQYREILYSSLEEYERLARMINDMLFLAQADRGQLQTGTRRVDLAHEVRALFDYFEAWAEESGVHLQLDGEALTTGDSLMLRRALSNLLTNAIRHTAPGQTVRVELRCDVHAVCIGIENPGPEIPAEQLSRLFDRFYRADPSRTRQGEGGGLGLAIVQSIVQAHGGTVDVHSQEGLTRFEVHLARAET